MSPEAIFIAIATVVMAFIVFGRRRNQYPPNHPYYQQQQPPYPHQQYPPPYGPSHQQQDNNYTYQYPPPPYQQPPYYQQYGQYPPPHHFDPNDRRNDSSSFLPIFGMIMLVVLGAIIVTKTNDNNQSAKDKDKNILTVTGTTPENKPNTTLANTSATIIAGENPLLVEKQTPPVTTAMNLEPVTPPAPTSERRSFYAIWLNEYDSYEKALALKNGFAQRLIEILELPNGKYLAYLHFDTKEACEDQLTDLNDHIKDFKPYQIYKKRIVIDLMKICPKGLIRINDAPTCTCGQ